MSKAPGMSKPRKDSDPFGRPPFAHTIDLWLLLGIIAFAAIVGYVAWWMP